ncbi:MAG: SPOR domain-containing protein [Pseudomonadota bacterium]
MAASSKKSNPFLGGFLVGLFVGLALAVAVALVVTRNNPFAGKAARQPAGAASAVAPAEAPKYEFYQTRPSEETAASAPVPAVAGPVYFLQAGAYGNAADADEMKARLALLGFEANIHSAQEGGTMLHKVRIGPYKSLGELNDARARLMQNGMDTMLVRILPKEKQ